MHRPILVTLVLAVSCGGSPQVRETTPDDGGQEIAHSETKTKKTSPAQELVALFRELEASITARKDDCDGFAEVLADWLASKGDIVRDLLILDHSDDQHEAIDASIHDTATAVVFAASECGESDSSMSAYDEFDALVL